MKIYYSYKTKKYHIITDKLTIRILDQIKEDVKITRVTTVTQVAAEVMPDPNKRKLVYTRLQKLNDLGLIEIIQRVNIKYILPRFKEVHLFKYTTMFSVPTLVTLYILISYLLTHIDQEYQPIALMVLLLLTLFVAIFLKERSVLTNILNL